MHSQPSDLVAVNESLIMNSPAPESRFQASAIASSLITAEELDYALRLARHRLAMDSSGEGQQSSVEDDLLDSPPVVKSLEEYIQEILIEQHKLTRYQIEKLKEGRTKFNLGPYVIKDFIGQGGMGQVFRAEHQIMGRECAVKVLPLTRATPDSQASFVREIRMQAKLDCPYLVRAFDAGQDGTVHYLVTEYVPGMDLRRLVRSRGPLSMQAAASIIRQAALGLDYAHQQGLIHRDVKPGNILVTPGGIAKVSDVGLAGFAQDLLDDPRAGKIMGTADYLSPEQIRTPLEVGPRSDIYALGCTLYYAVCGKVPFPGGDTASKIRRHLQETPWHPRRFSPDLSEDFVDIIADMMDKDPAQRIASAAEVAARVEPWTGEPSDYSGHRLSRSPWQAPPPPDSENSVPVEVAGSLPSAEDSQLRSSGEGNDQYSGIGSQSMKSASGNSELEKPPVPVGLAGPVESASHGPSTAVIVAITLAIAMPPTLLLGAIIGFLVRQNIIQ